MKKKEEILKLIKRKLSRYKEKDIKKIPIRFLQKDFELCNFNEDVFEDVLFELKDEGYIEKIVIPNPENWMADGYGLGSISGMDDNNFPGIFWINVSENFYKRYKKHEKKVFKLSQSIKLKSAKLKETDLMIEINKGERMIPFKSKKDGSETNHWKTVYHLWDFREEFDKKKNKLIKKGDWVTVSNLAKGAKINEGVVSKNISRLREKFQEHGIPIEIKPSGNGRYKLIINYN